MANYQNLKLEKSMYKAEGGFSAQLEQLDPTANYAGTELEMGTPLLKALCVMYGIPQFACLDAEGLDDVRNDKAAILADAERRADALAEEF